jgi:hypothetical protein
MYDLDIGSQLLAPNLYARLRYLFGRVQVGKWREPFRWMPQLECNRRPASRMIDPRRGVQV